MGKAKGRNRRERRSVDMSNLPAEVVWEPPPASECPPEDRVTFYLDRTNRMRLRLRDHHGTLVDFAIVHEALDRAGDWVEVSRVDCAHGAVHRHQFTNNKGELRQQELMKIESRSDVGKAYDVAYPVMMDQYEAHLERWRRGR